MPYQDRMVLLHSIFDPHVRSRPAQTELRRNPRGAVFQQISRAAHATKAPITALRETIGPQNSALYRISERKPPRHVGAFYFSQLMLLTVNAPYGTSFSEINATNSLFQYQDTANAESAPLAN